MKNFYKSGRLTHPFILLAGRRSALSVTYRVNLSYGRFREGIDSHLSGFIIGSHVGGNERQGLSLLQTNGKMTALTKRPDLIYHFGGISSDGQYLAWSSNERHSAFFDVYVYHLESGESTCVFQSDGTNHPVCLSPDGRHLLVSPITSNVNNQLYLVDVHSKTSKLLTFRDGEALWRFSRSDFADPPC